MYIILGKQFMLKMLSHLIVVSLWKYIHYNGNYKILVTSLAVTLNYSSGLI